MKLRLLVKMILLEIILGLQITMKPVTSKNIFWNTFEDLGPVV